MDAAINRSLTVRGGHDEAASLGVGQREGRIAVRGARWLDLLRVRALVREEFLSGEADSGFSGYGLSRALRGGRLLVLTLGGRVRGFVALSEASELLGERELAYRDMDGGDVAKDVGSLVVSSLLVAKRERGRGYGGLLLDAAAAIAADLGYGSLRVDVSCDNVAARSLCAGRGFATSGHMRVVWCGLLGEERVFMERNAFAEGRHAPRAAEEELPCANI